MVSTFDLLCTGFVIIPALAIASEFIVGLVKLWNNCEPVNFVEPPTQALQQVTEQIKELEKEILATSAALPASSHNIENLTVAQLRKMAQAKQIKGARAMNKSDLVFYLREV